MTSKIRNPRFVIITGAGSGIGRATALRFGKAGSEVLCTDINAETSAETAAMIIAAGGKARSERLDVTDDDAWQALAKRLRDEGQLIELLVNNAGVGVVGAFLAHSKDDWDRQINVNLNGVVNGCRAVAPLMVEARHGHIVNIASVAAYTPFGMMPSYCVSKASVRMFSECLRLELAPHNVGVSAICPGAVATNIVKNSEFHGDVGIEDMDHKKEVAGEVAVKYGQIFRSPNRIAWAIERAARRNQAVVPVRPEAWLGYLAHRASPTLMRIVIGQATPARLKFAGNLADRLVLRKATEILGPIFAPEAFAEEPTPAKSGK
ncbi:putative oxidoreductase [Gordonia effusa NBRC 100432]|uniref:Putative oxidoreductase n=1 Tax=Gordonia effusa NBRC 100432 TaxID=1077974 RepID=H0R4W7_9ACTN|nr:SDR family NAD(P)-dependent oxidoreductase [Gordonia effusa]GAB20118.1 putative oxidoreductase [Gordonia effusa NBRC 100432]